MIDRNDKSFQTVLEMQKLQQNLNGISRTPDMVRVLNQLEFNFVGVVDATQHKKPETLLKLEWFDSTFVVSDYSQPRDWLEKAIEEANRGKTVAMLVPARTNTAWFHEYIIGVASDIRFIRGSLFMHGKKRANTVPDCLVIYQTAPNKITRNDNAVHILDCRASFTENQTSWDVKTFEKKNNKPNTLL